MKNDLKPKKIKCPSCGKTMNYSVVPITKLNDEEFYEYFCKNKMCQIYEDGFFLNEIDELIHFN